MTIAIQKKREIEICSIFISAYDSNYSNYKYVPETNEQTVKSDIKLDYKNEIINFQVKEIPFHPEDKTQQQFNDEMGWVKAYKNGKKEPRMHVYSVPASPYQTAVMQKIITTSKQYKNEDKAQLDLLLLMNDSSLTRTQNWSYPELSVYGFRSISLITYHRNVTSMVLYASNEAHWFFRQALNIESECSYAPTGTD